MSIADYLYRESAIHRMSAGSKILVLLLTGTALFWINNVWGMLAFLVLAIAACGLSRVPAIRFVSLLKTSVWLFLLLFAFQLFSLGLASAVVVTLRLAILLLLSFLLTLTTTLTAMIATFEAALGWTRWFGGNPRKISLGFALAVRFIPLIADITMQVREAQTARGLENSVIGVALPVIMRTLKMADDIADAIDARSPEI